MPTATKSRKAAKPAPAPEPEVVEEDELEELDTDDSSDTPVAAKGGKQPEVVFGVSDLAAHLSTRDKKVTPRELRVLIRKMARDNSGRVTREIIPGNRARYNWSGLNDPEVQKIIAAYTAGELDADKKEKLDALKKRKAEQDAARKAAAETEEAEGEDEAEEAPAPRAKAKRSSKKAAPAPVVEEDEDDEDLDLDEE